MSMDFLLLTVAFTLSMYLNKMSLYELAYSIQYVNIVSLACRTKTHCVSLISAVRNDTVAIPRLISGEHRLTATRPESDGYWRVCFKAGEICVCIFMLKCVNILYHRFLAQIISVQIPNLFLAHIIGPLQPK